MKTLFLFKKLLVIFIPSDINLLRVYYDIADHMVTLINHIDVFRLYSTKRLFLLFCKSYISKEIRQLNLLVQNKCIWLFIY